MSYTGDFAVQLAITTAESTVVGGAVVGGASLMGTTVTVGGTAVTGMAGATGVGGAVIAVGGGAYYLGSLAAPYTTVPVADWVSGKIFDWWYGN